MSEFVFPRLTIYQLFGLLLKQNKNLMIWLFGLENVNVLNNYAMN